MPKVILVDDEIWTIRCLESLLADYPNYHIAGLLFRWSGGPGLSAKKRLRCGFYGLAHGPHERAQAHLRMACRKKIPVRMVIISAYSDFSAAREGIRNGVIDYLTKPITRKDMAALIQRLDATFLDEHTSRRLSLCQTIERAYPECRVLCCGHMDSPCKQAISLQEERHCAVGMDPTTEDGMALAYLSNPVGKPPEILRHLPGGIGISRAEKALLTSRP